MERLAAEIGAADGLVLNAAICPWDDDWLAAEWDASFNRVMAVNVLGPIHALRAFLPGMLDRRRGHVVFVGSLAGRSGGLIAGPHYVASKGAVHALVKWLARQVAPQNVIVNGVAPASVETPMMRDRPVDLDRIPLGRMGKPEEIALADCVPLLGRRELRLRRSHRREWRCLHGMRSLPAVQHSQGSAMRPFTVGIIGCGWAGARHARAFASQPGVAVTWAIDLHAARGAGSGEPAGRRAG